MRHDGYDLDDAALIALAQDDDRDAYAALVRRYQDLAFRTALVILRDPADAEDAAQSAFMKAWLALDRFRAGAPFRPWLLRIVANEARNLRLAQARRTHRRVPDASIALETAADDAPAPRRWPQRASRVPGCSRTSHRCGRMTGWSLPADICSTFPRRRWQRCWIALVGR